MALRRFPAISRRRSRVDPFILGGIASRERRGGKFVVPKRRIGRNNRNQNVQFIFRRRPGKVGRIRAPGGDRDKKHAGGVKTVWESYEEWLGFVETVNDGVGAVGPGRI
jgi:hypothetical protein